MRFITAFCVGAVALAGCAASSNTHSADAGATAAEQASAPDAVLVVKGMSCPNCATNVDKQLVALPGVTSARVDLGSGEVLVGFSAFEDPPSDEDLRRAIVDSGYTLESITRR